MKKMRKHILYAYTSMQRLVLREVMLEQRTKIFHTDELFRGKCYPFLKYDGGLGSQHPIHSTLLQMSYSEPQEVDHSKLLAIENKISHLLGSQFIFYILKHTK